MALALRQAVTPVVAARRRARVAPRRVLFRAKPGFASPRVRTTRIGSSEDGNENGVDEIDDEIESPDTSSPDSSPLGDFISSPLFYVTGGIALGVAVVQRFENAALFLSAFPIVGLTVLSKTDFGENLQNEVLAKRPQLELAALEWDAERRKVRTTSKFFGPHRTLFTQNPPEYLKGELPGDYGFDPLGLGRDDDDDDAKTIDVKSTEEPNDTGYVMGYVNPHQPVLGKNLARGVELELLHSRWAMLAVVGVVVPELVNDSGLLGTYRAFPKSQNCFPIQD